MSRQQPSLRTSRIDAELRRFPRYMVNVRRSYWRAVPRGHGPWWFGSTLRSRFDLPFPSGTCYLASDDLGALLEILGPQLLPGGLAPASLVRGRHLHQLHIPGRHRVADCIAQRAAKWITADTSTLTPYDVPQLWARAFDRAGFDGVRYAPRHATSRRIHSLALFGPAGERRDWPPGRALPLEQRELRRLSKRCGITLFTTPYADELVFATLPPDARWDTSP